MPAPSLALLERLALVLREEQRAAATRHGLPLAQLEALLYLAEANRFSDTLSGLVAYLGATKGTLSQTLSALERKGLVARVDDPGDRRVQHCRPTARGRALADAVRAEAEGRTPTPPEGLDVERLVHQLLAARGSRPFGVCATCGHHDATPGARRCVLLGLPLSEEDAALRCREHVPEG